AVLKSGFSHSSGSCSETSCKPDTVEQCKRGPIGDTLSGRSRAGADPSDAEVRSPNGTIAEAERVRLPRRVRQWAGGRALATLDGDSRWCIRLGCRRSISAKK